jgi:flagellar biosynthesis chaperone FliJ
VVLEREQRVAALRRLIDGRQKEQNRVAERRDQRATDEAAQRSRANASSRLTPSMI